MPTRSGNHPRITADPTGLLPKCLGLTGIYAFFPGDFPLVIPDCRRILCLLSRFVTVYRMMRSLYWPLLAYGRYLLLYSGRSFRIVGLTSGNQKNYAFNGRPVKYSAWRIVF